jgi:hypothetical protein
MSTIFQKSRKDDTAPTRAEEFVNDSKTTRHFNNMLEALVKNAATHMPEQAPTLRH